MNEKKSDSRVLNWFRAHPIISLGVGAFVFYLAVHYWTAISSILANLIRAAMPLFVGCFIAYAINILMKAYEKPFRNFGLPMEPGQRHAGVVRGILILLSFLTLIGIIGLVVGLIVPQMRECMEVFIRNRFTIADQLAAILDNIPGLGKYGAQIQEMVAENPSSLLRMGASLLSQGEWTGTAISVVRQISSGAVTVGIGIFFSVYLLAGKERLGSQVKRLIHIYMPSRESKVFHVIEVFDYSYRNFIVGQVKDAICLGIICTVGMFILRIPYAPMIGVLIAVTALVPIVGAFIGAVIGALLILAVSPWKALLFLIFFVVAQQFDNNVTYPRIVGSSIGLPGIWVLAAVTIGGSIFGFLGMLFFIPLFSACYKLIREDVNKREAEEKEKEKEEAVGA